MESAVAHFGSRLGGCRLQEGTCYLTLADATTEATLITARAALCLANWRQAGMFSSSLFRLPIAHRLV